MERKVLCQKGMRVIHELLITFITDTELTIDGFKEGGEDEVH